jgi:acyl-CoA dehydrogenase
MDFSLTDEQKMVQQTVRDFVNRELVPFEGEVLRNEREGRIGFARDPGRYRY